MSLKVRKHHCPMCECVIRPGEKPESSARPAGCAGCSFGGAMLDDIRQSPRAFGDVGVVEDMSDCILSMHLDIQRALDAWDSSVLERSRDGRMQEAMETLRIYVQHND